MPSDIRTPSELDALATRVIDRGYRLRRRRRLQIAGSGALALALAIALIVPVLTRSERSGLVVKPVSSPKTADASQPEPAKSRPGAPQKAAQEAGHPEHEADGRALDAKTPQAIATNGRIAFVSGREGQGDIYTIEADGTGLRRLTSETSNEGSPAWSPEGERIAFTSDRDGTWGLYVMEADGRNVRRVQTPTKDTFDPAWSPDGSMLAFTGRYDNLTSSRPSDIFIMPATGGAAKPITRASKWNSFAPSWSPDGRRIAYTSANPNGFCSEDNPCRSVREIHVFDMGTGSDRRIGPGNYPAWSPKGDRIAFLRDDSHALWISDPDGENLRALHEGKDYYGRPGWSPDASTIVFDRDPDGRMGAGCTVTAEPSRGCDVQAGPMPPFVYLIRPDGSELRQLSTSGDAFAASWAAA